MAGAVNFEELKMKRIISFAAVLLLAFCISATAYATPQTPVINSQVPDSYSNIGEYGIELYTDIEPPADGWLEIQWYSTNVNDISTIMAIIGANGSTYSVPQEVGVKYFCYGVWNVTSDGRRSDPVYSRLIRTEYYPAAPALELLELPDKQSYTLGEAFDPKGMRIRVHLPDGSYFDSENGDKLTYPEYAFSYLGMQSVDILYENGYIQLTVSVEEKAHVHSYGEWMTLTLESCEEPGFYLRECDCGREDRKELPALGHEWDGGKVLVEAEIGKEGVYCYSCTRCDCTKSETIPAMEELTMETPPTQTQEPKPTDLPAAATHSEAESQAETQQEKSGNGLLIVLIVLMSLVIVGLGAVIYILNAKNKK